MKHLKLLAALLLLPFAANADFEIEGVEGISDWYFHADFDNMRNTPSGKKIYAWLEAEAFDELREEAGIDIDKDLDQLIAMSDGQDDIVILANGTLRQEHKDQIMAVAAIQNVELAPRKAGKREYYYVEGEGGQGEPFEDGAFFSFDLKNKLIVTSSEDKMKELLGNGGRLEMRSNNTMVMFSAKNANVGQPTDGGEDWDSNIMQNTEEAKVLIADDAGKVRVEAQLVTTEAEMADSLASIVRGLISLQAFNEDIEPEMSDILKTTKVDVSDRTLSISLSLDADTVVEAMD